jgi:hypothetical protein
VDPTESESEQYVQDLQGLERAWHAYVDYLYDGSQGHIHPPPALMEATERCWIALVRTATGDRIDPNETEVPPETSVTLPAGFLSMYGAAMFEYGQRCTTWGILVQNMLQCKCDAVKEEDLDQALSEWSKKEGDK